MTDDWIRRRPIAHRGLHGPDAPENSRPAFRAAIEAGYPIELDVRLTRDGIPVVFHDATLDRLTTDDRPVAATTWAEIADLGLAGSDVRIPRLQSVLSLVDGRVPLLIELKNTGTGHALETAVASRLDRYEGPFAVQSFNPVSLAYFRACRPSWPRGQLASATLDQGQVPRRYRVLLERLIASGVSWPRFIAYRHDQLPYWPVTLHQRLGIPVLAWTVRTDAERRRALRYADNVIFEGIRP